jgi:Membrane transporters of cations and cationic drugs
MIKQYLFLFAAISFELLGTTTLKMSDQFSRFLPAVVCVVSYLLSFYFLSFTLKVIPISIAYAIWSGVGIFFTTILGAVLFKQIPGLATILGLILIASGVIIINIYSNSSLH